MPGKDEHAIIVWLELGKTYQSCTGSEASNNILRQKHLHRVGHLGCKIFRDRRDTPNEPM